MPISAKSKDPPQSCSILPSKLDHHFSTLFLSYLSWGTQSWILLQKVFISLPLCCCPLGWRVGPTSSWSSLRGYGLPPGQCLAWKSCSLCVCGGSGHLFLPRPAARHAPLSSSLASGRVRKLELDLVLVSRGKVIQKTEERG